MWRELIVYCVKNSAYVGCDLPDLQIEDAVDDLQAEETPEKDHSEQETNQEEENEVMDVVEAAADPQENLVDEASVLDLIQIPSLPTEESDEMTQKNTDEKKVTFVKPVDLEARPESQKIHTNEKVVNNTTRPSPVPKKLSCAKFIAMSVSPVAVPPSGKVCPKVMNTGKPGSSTDLISTTADQNRSVEDNWAVESFVEDTAEVETTVASIPKAASQSAVPSPPELLSVNVASKSFQNTESLTPNAEAMWPESVPSTSGLETKPAEIDSESNSKKETETADSEEHVTPEVPRREWFPVMSKWLRMGLAEDVDEAEGEDEKASSHAARSRREPAWIAFHNEINKLAFESAMYRQTHSNERERPKPQKSRGRKIKIAKRSFGAGVNEASQRCQNQRAETAGPKSPPTAADSNTGLREKRSEDGIWETWMNDANNFFQWLQRSDVGVREKEVPSKEANNNANLKTTEIVDSFEHLRLNSMPENVQEVQTKPNKTKMRSTIFHRVIPPTTTEAQTSSRGALKSDSRVSPDGLLDPNGAADAAVLPADGRDTGNEDATPENHRIVGPDDEEACRTLEEVARAPSYLEIRIIKQLEVSRASINTVSCSARPHFASPPSLWRTGVSRVVMFADNAVHRDGGGGLPSQAETFPEVCLVLPRHVVPQASCSGVWRIPGVAEWPLKRPQ